MSVLFFWIAGLCLRQPSIPPQTNRDHMPVITFGNMPEPARCTLGGVAAERRVFVKALPRGALTDPAHRTGAGGIDFGKLAALGLTEDGPDWTEALDDPTFGRRVLEPDAG
jgi:hypothetical protein